MKNVVLLLLLAFSAVGATEKFYFDIDDMPTGEDCFPIHLGENVWIETSEIHRDVTGFYTYTHNISLMPNSMEYEKKWKCPYCNRYWPIGTSCQNRDCPSKYKYVRSVTNMVEA
jgi:hypothetical protein